MKEERSVLAMLMMLFYLYGHIQKRRKKVSVALISRGCDFTKMYADWPSWARIVQLLSDDGRGAS